MKGIGRKCYSYSYSGIVDFEQTTEDWGRMQSQHDTHPVEQQDISTD